MTVKELHETLQKLMIDGYGEMDVLVHERDPGYALEINRVEIDYESEGEVINIEEYDEYEENDREDFTKCVIIWGD